jgi:hypothetical protein
MGTKYFMAVGAIKAFNNVILLWFARLDKFEVYALRVTPTRKDSRPKFAPVI